MSRLNHFKRKLNPLMILGGIAFAVLLAFIFGYVVMLLWNWLMPSIFGLGEIDYWKAWGLLLLSHILFKSGNWSDNDGRGHHHKGKGKKGWCDDSCSDEEDWKDWKQHFKAKFNKPHPCETTDETPVEPDETSEMEPDETDLNKTTEEKNKE